MQHFSRAVSQFLKSLRPNRVCKLKMLLNDQIKVWASVDAFQRYYHPRGASQGRLMCIYWFRYRSDVWWGGECRNVSKQAPSKYVFHNKDWLPMLWLFQGCANVRRVFVRFVVVYISSGLSWIIITACLCSYAVISRFLSQLSAHRPAKTAATVYATTSARARTDIQARAVKKVRATKNLYYYFIYIISVIFLLSILLYYIFVLCLLYFFLLLYP